MSKHATLIKPAKTLPHYSNIENVLSLLPLVDIAPDLYTNARPLWHPPGARGIFGGAAIAQCLSAAQATIPPDFSVHSMHCYFVLAGNSEIPLMYHVERVRDGKSYITRTVQARQRGKCIFTTTLSFMKEGSAGKKKVEHFAKMPDDVIIPPDGDRSEKALAMANAGDNEDEDDRPFESLRCAVTSHGKPPSEKKVRQWIRARGRISEHPPNNRAEGDRTTSSSTSVSSSHSNNHEAHLSALAYMTDSNFIGTAARVHNLMRFSNQANIDKTLESFKGSDSEKQKMRTYLEAIAKEEADENASAAAAGRQQHEQKQKPENIKIGMMVSLDHAIFFHNPRSFRADEWMLAEMESPWAGDGRGVVYQRIWSKDGVLIATCIQEGCVRLVQDKESKL